MIDWCYRMIEWMEKKGIRGRKVIYRLLKLAVNIIYPLLVPLHRTYGVNPDASCNTIVSLTSFPDRIKTVHITIDTLLRQSVKPNRVILWLAESQFDGEKSLPRKLSKMQKRGLEIRFCKLDLRSHKKYYYTMSNYGNSNVITVDDDMYYGTDLIENFLICHQRYPDAVLCNWGHIITMDESGKINLYNHWDGGVSGHLIPEIRLVPIGAEGVFYPANSVNKEVFSIDKILNCVPYADDLWLKCMSLMNNTLAARVHKIAFPYFNIITAQHVTLQKMNIAENGNDAQLHSVLEKYPVIRKKIEKSILEEL